MKASDLISRVLEDEGVTHVYEMIGGMITHILNSISRSGKIEIISMHHEQGAAFAADGHARMTGRPYVALATSGPGATNLLTGIGDCYFDSIPAVFITGQVNRGELKGAGGVRQLGFQETDICSMARPVTKAVFQVLDPSRLQETLVRAFAIASSGRRGPVLVDIPMDVQRCEVEYHSGLKTISDVPAEPDENVICEVLDALRRAERPLLLLGGGLRGGNAADALSAFLRKVRVPVCHSLMGLDSIDAQNPLRVGLIGSYGNRWANFSLGECDTLLVLGSRLDIRQTGANIPSFKGSKRIIQVDCDPQEMNNRVSGCRAVAADVRVFLEGALKLSHEEEIIAPRAWFNRIQELKARYPDEQELAQYPGINPVTLVHRLSERGCDCAGVAVDVGQHQMWAAQGWSLRPGQRFLTSGGMGSMGFALPAAVGACFAADRRPFLVIAGDGGFQCNIQELETVHYHGLPLKMVVMDNGGLGMVRQFQESYFNGLYQSTRKGYSAPRFERVAEAYGISGRRVSEAGELDAAVSWLFEGSEAKLLTVEINGMTNVYPKLAFGKAFTDMEPQAAPVPMGAV